MENRLQCRIIQLLLQKEKLNEKLEYTRELIKLKKSFPKLDIHIEGIVDIQMKYHKEIFGINSELCKLEEKLCANCLAKEV